VERRIERGENEFSRTLSFFDATFALSMTLLVTTIDPGTDGWRSWSSLWDSVGYQVIAFAISFALVATYWWGNHRFVASLETLSPQLIVATVAMLGFVALIPFTTDALGNEGRAAVEVTTVVYAANIAIVSGMATVLYLLARHDGLFRHPPTDDEARLAIIDRSVSTVVFLVSIPVAVLVSGSAGRWCWLSLLVLGPPGRAPDRPPAPPRAAPPRLHRGRLTGRRADRSRYWSAGTVWAVTPFCPGVTPSCPGILSRGGSSRSAMSR